ncbi:DUF2500 domain-containing protein [Peribacillus sp. SCS-37]|uniref:DUF2500 domain-containing protein n=1 Tax=Paraperibacillus esterisolvens TaxID=3115296 RepID=UPI003905E764
MFEKPQDDFMFQAVPIFIGIIFFIVAALIVTAIISSIVQWNKNNNSPRLSANARLIAKRTEISGGGDRRAFTYYFAAFQTDSGSRMEFELKDREYGLLAEGDEGVLDYQGTRFLGFIRRGILHN